MAQAVIVERPADRRELARFANQLAAADWIQRHKIDADIIKREPARTPDGGWTWKSVRVQAVRQRAA